MDVVFFILSTTLPKFVHLHISAILTVWRYRNITLSHTKWHTFNPLSTQFFIHMDFVISHSKTQLQSALKVERNCITQHTWLCLQGFNWYMPSSLHVIILNDVRFLIVSTLYTPCAYTCVGPVHKSLKFGGQTLQEGMILHPPLKDFSPVGLDSVLELLCMSKCSCLLLDCFL